jgi:uncharacterized membrane protein
MVALVAAGAALRLFQYLANRSLWLDEALVAPQVLDRTFGQLLNPASWGALPPGYLLLTKAATTAFGSGEYALRFVPLLAGLASLPLFGVVAKRCLGRAGSVLALWFFAFSPYLIYYASEVKPYSSDVAVTLALLLLALRLSEREVTVRGAALWLLAGLAAAGLSLTSAFVTGGATLALLLRAWRRGERAGLHRLLLAGAAWLTALGVPYVLFVAGTARAEYLQQFWQSGFMPLPPRSLADLEWFPRTLYRVF